MTDRVLEIGGYAAAYCGRMFVREGADVVQLKRSNNPAWAPDDAMDLHLNCGKRQLNTTDTGLIRRLAESADVVIVEGATASEVLALGLSDLPDTVSVVLTPFGMTGPKRDWRATPSTLLAMGGYTILMGDADKAPLNLPGHYVEMQTGALAFMAANACRLAGQAEQVDISMLETVMSLSQFTTVRYHCAGEQRTRHGNDFWYVVPSEMFRCADGWVYVNIVPAFWDAFVVFVDRPELLVDERFADNDLRMLHRVALHDIVAHALADVPVAEITERAAECRVPVGVVMDFDQVLQDQHLASRHFWEVLDDPQKGALRLAGSPYRTDHMAADLPVRARPVSEPELW